MKIVNLTGHDVAIYDENGVRVMAAEPLEIGARWSVFHNETRSGTLMI